MATKTIWKLRCPDCGERYIVANGEAPPNFCKSCGTDFRVEPNGEFVPKAPAIRTDQTKANDWAYRKAEADSEARAEAALPAIEQQLIESGIPVDQAQRMAAQQASDLKVTNLKDNLREGEVAAMPKASPIYQQQVTSLGGDPNGSFVGGMGVAGSSPAPVNESGAKVMNLIQGSAWRGRGPAAGNATVAGMQGGFGKAG